MIECINNAKNACKNADNTETQNWEFLKKTCRNFAQKFSKERKKEKSELLNNLQKLRQELLVDQVKNQHVVNIQETLNLVENKINEIETEKVNSSIFRSRCRWTQQGQKMTKYYFSLEKRNYLNKTTFSVFLSNGDLCTQQKGILAEQEKFYKALYTKDTQVEFKISNMQGPKLNDQQKKDLESEITWNEIQNAVFSMKLGKVPGCDGLSVAFYRKFCNVLREPMWKMYQEVLCKGKFGISGKKGIMSLIPKKGKDTRYIKHLRPLTLLNNDFKFLAKVMANRLKRVLPSIIGDQQTGFMEKRSIQENLRTTIDVVSHVYQAGKRAVIVSIDFLKCFDRIEHDSIYAAMKLFNFGERFIQYSKIFFADLMVCTQNAGYFSEFFSKTRGVNQGCNYSPFCFLICGEIIKYNPYIKGIKVGNSEVERIISQFADDTGLFLLYEEKCIETALSTLAQIESSIGLKVSYEKTCIYRIGSLKNSDAKIYTTKPIQWSDEDIEMLGFRITNGPVQEATGILKVFNKMEQTAMAWHNRTLSLMGKVLLVNSLMSSLFVYQMYNILCIDDKSITRFVNMVNKFLWKGKRAKIPMNILQNSKKDGGLGLVCIKSKHKSVLLSWVPVVCKNERMTYVYNYLVPTMKELIWDCNLRERDIEGLCQGGNVFWTGILKLWSEETYIDPQGYESIAEQIFWCNTHIRTRGQMFLPIKMLIDSGITKI